MANRLYNKQVTPKGYQKGGSVRDTRKTEQMIGASISSKREKGRAKKMGGGMMMKRPMMKEGGKAKKKKPIRKVSFGAMLEAATEKNRNPMKDQRLDDSIKGKTVRFIEDAKAKGGMIKRSMMKEGGKLKMVMKGGKKVPFFAADGKGAKDLGKAAMKKGGLAKLNPGLKAFMKKKMAKKK